MDTPPNPNPSIAPLTIQWGRWQTLYTVSDLAQCLVRDWPQEGRGDGYLTALLVCQAIMSGMEEGDTADDARAAFIEAAFEAGLSVADDDDGPDF